MAQLPQPDPSGGYGSFPQSLLGVITGGLQTVALGEGIKRYGFAFGADGRQYDNGRAGVVPAAAPAAEPAAAETAANALSNPWVIAAGFGVLLLVVVLVRR
jgi:hypothetical protein